MQNRVRQAFGGSSMFVLQFSVCVGPLTLVWQGATEDSVGEAGGQNFAVCLFSAEVGCLEG